MNPTRIGVGGALALAAGVAFSPAHAMAGVAGMSGSLGFENPEHAQAGVTPVDGAAVGAEYQATTGMSFGIDANMDGAFDPGVSPFLNQVGWQSNIPMGDVQDAYWSQLNKGFDTARPGFESQLGGWFLRTKTTVQPEPGALLVVYDVPVFMAKGEIWDIDGLPDDSSIYFGTEQFLVEALDAGGNVIESILSPLGDSADPDLSLDSAPWTWTFHHASDDIHAVRIAFVGQRELGAGYGHDNFAWASTIPAPSSLAPLAVLGLGTVRRRRR